MNLTIILEQSMLFKKYLKKNLNKLQTKTIHIMFNFVLKKFFLSLNLNFHFMCYIYLLFKAISGNTY